MDQVAWSLKLNTSYKHLIKFVGCMNKTALSPIQIESNKSIGKVTNGCVNEEPPGHPPWNSLEDAIVCFERGTSRQGGVPYLTTNRRINIRLLDLVANIACLSSSILQLCFP
ncbi:hypothetical protein SLA2020_273460 [Shorea laevis]